MNNPGSLKIVLVQPPVEDFYFTPHRSSVLGLHTLAALWKARGHRCQILNCTMEKPLKKQISLPGRLSYLGPYLFKQAQDMQGTSWFRQYYRFGPSIEICAKKIEEYKPDVVAVSCFAWSYADNTRRLLEKLKKVRQQQSTAFLLVAGGPGVTVMPEYFTSCTDLVVAGEGEDAVSEIEDMAGKGDYPFTGKIIDPGFNGALPFVYSIKSRKNSRFTVSTIISRGCPKMCSFCANYLVFGRSLRKVPLGDLKKGMNSLINKIADTNNLSNTLPAKQDQNRKKLHINFEDDNILFYKEYFLEILNYIKEKCYENEIDFSFTTENGMDYLLLDRKLLDKFKNLNIVQLNLSMASMDQEQLKKEKRSGNLNKLESIIEYSDKLNIPAVTYFICGLKGDTSFKTVQTINYLHSLNTTIGISLYYPVPGLVVWQNRDLFLENPPSLCRGSSAWPWNNCLSTKELITAFRLARTSNYIKTSNPDSERIEELKTKLLEDITMDGEMIMMFFKSIFMELSQPADPKTS